MFKRGKLLAFSILTAIILSASSYFLYHITSSIKLISALPLPPEEKFYLLLECKKHTSPETLFSFLADGEYSLLKEGTPGALLLSIASTAEKTALLIEEENSNNVKVYLSLLYSKEDMQSLKKGTLPTSIANVLKEAEVAPMPRKNRWIINSKSLSASIYYQVHKDQIIIAAEPALLDEMGRLLKGEGLSFSKKKWVYEGHYDAHLELSDGGFLNSLRDKSKSSIKVEVAWNSFYNQEGETPLGELKWKITGADKNMMKAIASSFAPTKWDKSSRLIPDPLLLAFAVNVSSLKGTPKDWLFPFNKLALIGENMKLKTKEVRELLSGKIMASAGGHNHILWFDLPGFLIEFSTEQKTAKAAVDAFWKNLFLGTEPNPVTGYKYGGSASMPFSTLGVADENKAFFGLISPDTIKAHDILSKFLKEDEKAIGWLVADFPLIGVALDKMSRMSFFADDDLSTENSSSFEESEGKNGIINEDFLSPQMNLPLFDQEKGISFIELLKKLGKISLVWETYDSGRLNLINYAETKNDN